VQVYFELSHEDTIHSSNGSNHIVPIQWTTLSGSDGTPQLSHDCGTFGELNHVIDDMISDLEKQRRRNTSRTWRVVSAPGGIFIPGAVRDPLSDILKRPMEIANFQDTLKDFAEKRGQILERTGEPRAFRFRFQNLAMQPYVIMRGIRDGIVSEAAKQALSSPEQPDLFPSG
jgi:hypothetical protein